jgi:magnesium transporter
MALARGVLQPPLTRPLGTGGPPLALRASNVTQDPGPKVALRATLYDADGRDREVEPAPGIVDGLGERQLLWIDLDGRDEAGIARLVEIFDLPDETAKVLASDRAVAQLLRYSDRVHLRLVAMQPTDGDEAPDHRPAAFGPTSIDVIVAPNVVITSRRGQLTAFDQFADHIRGDSALGALNAADFLTVLVDSVLAVYLQIVESIARRIDALDEVALRTSEADSFLREVVVLRRRVAILRRGLAPHRWAFAALARPDFELEGVGKPWPGILERLDKAVDAVENARDQLIGAFDVYMATSAQRTNDVMKTLTILSAILLPAVVLAGVMGMNFKIGFFENAENFWLAVGAMLTLAVSVLGISRWRGWI